MFSRLPPPTSSIPSRPQQLSRSSSGVTPRAAPVNMASFNSASAPCFHGECQVLMRDGSLKMVSEIKKGDQVSLAAKNADQSIENYAVIECVVRTRTTLSKPFQLLKILGGLKITPWHPICEYREDSLVHWVFPIYSKLADIYNIVECNEVYSFVLEVDSECITKSEALTNTVSELSLRGSGKGMIINNIECATMGHGIMNTPTISHPFYGTQKVVNELMRSSGWKNGVVELNSDSLIRDPESGLICGFKF